MAVLNVLIKINTTSAMQCNLNLPNLAEIMNLLN